AHVPLGLNSPSGAKVLTRSDDCPAARPVGAISTAAPSIASSPRRASSLRRAGLQRERVQLAAHFGLERLIDDLMLLHARFSAERFGEHGGGVMVAVAGEVADDHLGIGNTQLDQALDLACSHRHGSISHSAFRRNVADSPRKPRLTRTYRSGRSSARHI